MQHPSLLTTQVTIDLRAELERGNRNPAHEAQDMSAEMKPVLEGITVLADDVPTLANFYREALGMVPTVEEAHYVAFSDNALRFAIFHVQGWDRTRTIIPTIDARSAGRLSS
jgi:hypothetical protein